MGKGARVRIENGTGEDFNISYDNFVEVYQNGQEGSDFKSDHRYHQREEQPSRRLRNTIY